VTTRTRAGKLTGSRGRPRWAPTVTRSWWRLGAPLLALVAATSLVVLPAQPANADPNALTDDTSVSVPTQWWTYTNVTTAEIANRINQHGARLTDIEPYNDSGTRFTVVMVRNTGAYQVPGWWWYVGLTFNQVSSTISSTGGRLVDIETYLVNGQVRYAIVLVSNTGGAARAWWWLSGVSATAVSNLLPANVPNQGNPAKRLVDLESITVNGSRTYSAIFIANTGSDAKAWQWWLNQTPASIGQRVNAFGGRITNLERQDDGTYNFIQVRNSGSDNKYWRYYFGLSSASATNQVALQYGTRVFDLETYVVNGQRRYDSVMIDNVNAETRRVSSLMEPAFTGSNGLPTADFGFYLKRVGGSQVSGLQTDLTWEPASAVKAVHNLAVMRSGESLNSSFIFYTYPNSPFNAGTKDACPIPGDEVAANRLTNTLDWGKDRMMTLSDNRTTRGVVLRYGLSTIQNTAAVAGMTSTTINQDQVGCGFLGGKRNFTTLVDLGRLYERVENGSLLGTGGLRTEFFQPMNSGANTLTGIVTAEANAMGKGSSASAFIARIRNQFKGGTYDIPCSQAGCSNGQIYIRTNAGRIALPIRTGPGSFGERVYVYGVFVDDQFNCSGCSTATWDSALTTVGAELFRAEIRSALQTW
jgi:hypothetical protein